MRGWIAGSGERREYFEEHTASINTVCNYVRDADELSGKLVITGTVAIVTALIGVWFTIRWQILQTLAKAKNYPRRPRGRGWVTRGRGMRASSLPGSIHRVPCNELPSPVTLRMACVMRYQKNTEMLAKRNMLPVDKSLRYRICCSMRSVA